MHMRAAIRSLWVVAVLSCVGGASHPAGAVSYSAGIREYYTGYGRNDYASDSASKLKMTLSNLGFPSITLQMRIAAPSLSP
ncbi:MAG: hypothetical protein EBX52_05965, partial [Proteobacteria bacterium]|nr:hypothetical protein [Pseudomonadota bacterium]